MKQALSFDGIAKLYDEQRPGYPDALFEDLIEDVGLAPNAAVLEIGAGTGRASLPFLQRGFVLQVVEPGEALCQILVGHAEALGGVFVHNSTFEDANLTDRAFPLVFAAQSFHWLDPKTRLTRVARCLTAGGHLAVFGNAPGVSHHPADHAIQEVYQRHWPEAASGGAAKAWYASAESPLVSELDASNLFESPRVRRYSHSIEYSATQFGALMRTHSDHQGLPAGALDALVADIEAAIRDHGDSYRVVYTATLFVSRLATSV